MLVSLKGLEIKNHVGMDLQVTVDTWANYYSEGVETVHCSYSGEEYDMYEDMLVILDTEESKVPILKISLENIREFISDLEDFEKRNDSGRFTMSEGGYSPGDTTKCVICDESIELYEGFVSFTYELDDSGFKKSDMDDYSFAHMECRGVISDKIRDVLEDTTVFQNII